MFDHGITEDLKALYKAQDEALDPVPCTNDPDLFFPPNGNLGQHEWRMIRTACASCPIVAQCAEYGIKNDEHGVWGGMTVRQRADIRRARGKQVA